MIDHLRQCLFLARAHENFTIKNFTFMLFSGEQFEKWNIEGAVDSLNFWRAFFDEQVRPLCNISDMKKCVAPQHSNALLQYMHFWCESVFCFSFQASLSCHLFLINVAKSYYSCKYHFLLTQNIFLFFHFLKKMKHDTFYRLDR